MKRAFNADIFLNYPLAWSAACYNVAIVLHGTKTYKSNDT